jgi:hypothetical protein
MNDPRSNATTQCGFFSKKYAQLVIVSSQAEEQKRHKNAWQVM